MGSPLLWAKPWAAKCRFFLSFRITMVCLQEWCNELIFLTKLVVPDSTLLTRRAGAESSTQRQIDLPRVWERRLGGVRVHSFLPAPLCPLTGSRGFAPDAGLTQVHQTRSGREGQVSLVLKVFEKPGTVTPSLSSRFRVLVGFVVYLLLPLSHFPLIPTPHHVGLVSNPRRVTRCVPGAPGHQPGPAGYRGLAHGVADVKPWPKIDNNKKPF